MSFGSGNVASLYAGEHGTAGKVQLIRDQMLSLKFNFLGLQEARCPQICSLVDNIYRLGTGAHNGHWGVELWINLQQPFAYVDHTPILLSKSDVVVVHQDPRILIAKIDQAMWRACLVVAHAPQSGQSLADRSIWWDHFTSILQSNDDGAPIFVMLDANAAPGQCDEQIVGVGDLGESKSTPLFRQFLSEFGLCLPCTFPCHHGPRETWTSPHGHSFHCIDYICIPGDRLSACSLSRVVEEFDLVNGAHDHSLVAAQLSWHEVQQLQVQKKNEVRADASSDPFDRQSITRSQVAARVAQIQAPPWEVDIESHFQQYNRELLGSLTSCCPKKKNGPKKSFFTDDLWSLRKRKIAAKRQLCAVHRRQRHEFLGFFFKSWRQSRRSSASQEHGHFLSYVTTIRCWTLKIGVKLHVRAKQMREHLRQARHQALTKALSFLPDNASANDILQVIKAHIGPTNLRQMKRQTLPMLNDEDGTPCALPAQLLGRWIQFFGDMEGGTRMDISDQWTCWRANLEKFRQTQVHLQLEDLPTLTDLEIAFRRVPKHKASGLDRIPSELCGSCPRELARQNYGALLKLVIHGQECLGHKGGTLTPAHKGKGPLTDPMAYRSLLVSSHLGKTLHRTVRQTQAHLLEAFMSRSQLGGKRRVPVTLGLHEARAYLRAATSKKKAFYRVLRPLALGSDFTDLEVARMANRLHLHPDVMQELQQHLEDESAVAMAGMTPQAQRLLQAIHSDTFFKMPGQGDVCRTTIGSRPGDSFADVVFTFLFSRVLHGFQQKLLQHDLLEYIGVDEAFDPFQNSPCESQPQVVYSGPVWMDDLCVTMQAATADAVMAKAGVVTSLLLDTLHEHAMTPNLSRGKTELLLSLRGRGVRRLKTQHFGPSSSGTLPVIGEFQTFHIAVVGEYQHLGGIIHHEGDHRKEMRRRAAMAHQAFNIHRRNIFQNKNLALQKRVQLFQSLVLSKLLYGSESWHLADQRSKHFLHAAIMKLYRRLLRLRPDAAWHDDEICVALCLPTPTELLRRSRLRYLCTLHQYEYTISWRLLHDDQEWCNLVRDDLSWLWRQIANSSSLPDPSVTLDAWRYLWRFHPGYWKGLVRRAFMHSALQRQNDVLVRTHHIDFLEVLKTERITVELDAGQPEARHVETQALFACLGCRKAFRSKAGEGAHMFRCHGAISSLRWLFDTTACPSCLKEYHSFGRLKAHLYANEACRLRLQNRPALPAPEVGVGSTENTTLERRLNGLLPPLPGQGPHNRPSPLRDVEDFDVDLYGELTECLLHGNAAQHRTALMGVLEEKCISWTTCRRTLDALVHHVMPHDLQAFGYANVEQLRALVADLLDPAHWNFLRAAFDEKVLPDKAELAFLLDEAVIDDITTRPQAFGVHRLVLHAFSGRRRPGDFQEFLDDLMAGQNGIVVHVVSVDIVLSETWGDVTDPACQRFWYEGVRQKYVIGYLAGPPCETWSQARAVTLPDTKDNQCRGPRVLRTAQELWGMAGLAIREVRQVLTGNQLLLFSFHMMLLLYVSGGCGALEHPAQPKDEDKASIWRTSIARLLCRLPGVRCFDFAQGLLGAKSPKPTTILSLNLPDIVEQIWKGRVSNELPIASSIGRDDQGRWQTSALKEYPPAMCKALAESFARAVSDIAVDPAICISTEFWSRCKTMIVSEYGEFIGPDYAK